MSDPSPLDRSRESARLSADERLELERRLGQPFSLDGRFGSLWAIELLARTLRRAPAFRPLAAWVRPYLRTLFARAYREAGFELVDLGEGMLGVQAPGYVYNVDDAAERTLSASSPTAATCLSPIFGMALAPRAGLEAVTFGQPRLELERARHRPELERLVDWLVAEHLRHAVGGDPDLGEAGYEVARALVAPAYGYQGSDGVAQVARVAELLAARPEPRRRVLLGLAASQDLYLSTLAARCCLELGVSPTRELEARAMRRALRHFGGLPKAVREASDAIDAVLPVRESAIEGTDDRRYAEADLAAGAGRYDQAYGLLDALCRAAPNRAAYFCYRGFVAERLGRDARQSIEDYDRALGLQPDYWQALINRGVLLSRKGRYAEADRDLYSARALRPDCDDTRNNLLVNHFVRKLGAPGGGARPAPSDAAAAAPVAPIASPAAVAAPPGPAAPAGSAAPDDVEARSAAEPQEDFSQYEILELLGAGGMGKVYRVRHRGWDMELALKIPRVELLEQGGVAGFVEEAEAWSRLGSSPHTVDCHYVRMRKGVPWLFAEYVAGGSLADWIESGRLYEPPAAGESGVEPVVGRLVDVAIQVAYGLHHAHSHGLIHQDMKPANVLVSNAGVAKVTDFGLAKVTRRAAAAGEPGGTHETMMAGFAGMTPAYCSPEQARAARSGERVALTRRSDVWSWAVTVLEMFTGEVRWMTGVLAPACFERLAAGQDQPKSEAIPAMPAGLVELLRRCFALSEADRPADMMEVVTALGEVYRAATAGRAPRRAPSVLDDVAVVLNNRAASLLDLGRRDDAMVAWRRAVDAEPLHPEASYNLALGEWRGGLITDEEAADRVAAAVDAHEDDWRVRLLAAWIHHERADRNEVMKACVRTLRRVAADDATVHAVRRPYRTCPEGLQEDLRLELPSVPRAVAVSRDGRVAVTGHGTEVVVWSLGAASAPMARFPGVPTLVAVSDDGSIVAWANGRELAAARLIGRAVVRVEVPLVGALETCGPGAVVAASEERLLFIDVATGAVREIGRHAGRITGVDAMADGRLVASSSEDGTVVLRLADGRVTRTLRHEQPVDFVALTADGKRAVSGGWDAERSQYRLHLWETAGGSLIRRLEEPAPRRAVPTDDGSHVLSWSPGGRLRLWEVGSGRCLRTSTPLGDVTAVHSTDADDVLLVRGATLHRLRVLHGAPKAPVMVARPRPSEQLEASHARFRELLAHAEQACERDELGQAIGRLEQAMSVAGYGRHRDAQALATRIAHRTARGSFRASFAGRALRDLGGPVHAVALDAEAAVVTTVVYDEGSRLLEIGRHDARTGRPIAAMQVTERAGPLEALAIARDAPVVATSSGGTLRLWRLAESAGRAVAGERRVAGLALADDGRLAWVATPSSVGCWDDLAERWLEPIVVAAPRAIAVASGRDRLVLVPTRAGTAAAAAGSNVEPAVWSGAHRARLSALRAGAPGAWQPIDEAPGPAVDRVVLTPDARRVAALDDEGRVEVLDLATGTTLWRTASLPVSAMALADDGSLLLLGTRDGEVLLTDLRSSGEFTRLGRHRNEILSVALSRDGLLAVSGGRDGDVELWHLDWHRRLLAPGVPTAAGSWLDRFVAKGRVRADDPFGLTSEPTWNASDLDELGRDLGRLGLGRHDRASLEQALRVRQGLPPSSETGADGPGRLPPAPFDPAKLSLRIPHEPHRAGRPVGAPTLLGLRLLVIGDFGAAAAQSPSPVDTIEEALALRGSELRPTPHANETPDSRRTSELERRWGALALLHAEIGECPAAAIDLLDTGGEGAASIIERAALYRVLEAAYEREAPYSILVLDEPLAAEPAGAGLALVTALAQLARQDQAALLVGLDSSLALALSSSPPPGWDSFFADPAASYVALLADPLFVPPAYRRLLGRRRAETEESRGPTEVLTASSAYAGAISLVSSYARSGRLRLGMGELRSPADARRGANAFAVTLPLARIAAHLRLRYQGLERRDDLGRCRSELRGALAGIVAALGAQNAMVLDAALELGPHGPSHLRCDLWLMPRGRPAESVATSLLLAT